MELQHSFTVPASVGETWTAFNDLERIAPCFPGATLTSVEGDTFAGGVKVKLGPISLQYNGTGAFLERDEAAGRAVIEAKGKDKRGNGTAAANIVAQLSADGKGTKVDVTTDLNITGKPAQFGRGVIQDVSEKLLGQFVDCLQTKLGEPEAVADAEPAAAPPSSATPTGPVTEAKAAPAPGVRTPSGTGSSAHAAEAELDFMSTVAPVLAKRYAGPAIGLLLVLLVLRRLFRH